ncbi:MAG: phosphatidate cytidylyltransferase [Spirochaetales bacterium]|nr:phosphatidate cytidylyltransferase [Spirochaetales bacterium]
MSNNTLQRLLLFFVGIPALAVSAFVGRDHGLPVFGMLVIAASALAAWEAAFFFPAPMREYRGARVVIPFLGAAMPIVGYASIAADVGIGFRGATPSAVVVSSLVLLSTIIMAVQVLKRRVVEFNRIVLIVSSHLFIMVYPGLFTWHAIRLVGFDLNSELILLFFLSIYLNDSMAWVFGRLFGRATTRPGSPPPVAVSPNKSIIGFVGGFSASVAVLVLAGEWNSALVPGPLWMRLAFGALVGASTIVGDLVESAFKRSAAVKDSGNLIPGRGGLLDSIDSPLFTAPFFFYGYVILYSI